MCKTREKCCCGLPTAPCSHGACKAAAAPRQLPNMTLLRKNFLTEWATSSRERPSEDLGPAHTASENRAVMHHSSTTTSSSSCPELLHHLVPSGSWAAAGPPWRAYASAPARGACCTPAGWWARSGAGAGSAHSASSGWYWDGGTPAPAWTRADAAAWHAPGPSVSAFCLTPNRRTEGIIRHFVLTWISITDVTFHSVHKDISLFPRHLRTEHRVSFSVLSEADSTTGNFSFLISLFFFLF